MKVNVADFANLSLLALPAALQGKLQGAVVMPSEEIPPDVVTMQSRVVLVEDATGRRRTVSLVYPAEADADASRISVLDALGTALFGASLGDRIVVDTPEGSCRLCIEQIVYQPELSMRTHLFVRG
jgi:regulator of nucleoside diphosphate kinase